LFLRFGLCLLAHSTFFFRALLGSQPRRFRLALRFCFGYRTRLGFFSRQTLGFELGLRILLGFNLGFFRQPPRLRFSPRTRFRFLSQA